MGESVEFIGEPTSLLWGAAFFGFGAVVLVLRFRELVREKGQTRARLSLVGCVAFTILSLITYAGSHYPRARLTKADMYCFSWGFAVPWEYFSDIGVRHGYRFSTNAVFSLKPDFIDAVPWTDYVRERRRVTCQIDGLDRSSEDALKMMRSYWSSATGHPL